jgi:hypothetical protein
LQRSAADLLRRMVAITAELPVAEAEQPQTTNPKEQA